jgi:uncharacterized small protein (DUF1192 family)
VSESSLARSLFSGNANPNHKKPPLRKKLAPKAPQNPQNVVEGLAQEPESQSENIRTEPIAAIQPDHANSVASSLDNSDSKNGLDNSVNSLINGFNQNSIEDSGESIDHQQVKQSSHPKPGLELELKVMREEISILRSHYETEFRQKNEYIAQLEEEIEKLEQELAAIGTETANSHHSTRYESIASEQAEQILTLEQQNQELNSCLDLVKSSNDELSAKFNQQLATLTVLQQSLADSEQNSKRSQARVAELEERVAELQEQVLKQASKASEYEAAIQHWKEQSLNHQRRALHLSGALEKLLDDKEKEKHPRAGLPATANIPRSTPQPITRTVAKLAPTPKQEPAFTEFADQQPRSEPVYKPLAPYQGRNQADRQSYQPTQSANGANGNHGTNGTNGTNGVANRVPASVGARQEQKQTRKVDLPSFLIRNR